MSTATDKKYIKGIRLFKPREGAPDFIIGQGVITPSELSECLKEYDEFKSEYNGKTQFRISLLNGDNGPYIQLDTWKPTEKTNQEESDPLPF